MREIKFRCFYKDEDPTTMECFTFDEIKDSVGFGDSKDYHWMQFTGLQDKNGVEIYEGDRVEFSFTSEFRSYRFIGVVEHDTCNPCFVIVNPDNDNQIEFDWVMCGLSTLEVIGNIHEAK